MWVSEVQTVPLRRSHTLPNIAMAFEYAQNPGKLVPGGCGRGPKASGTRTGATCVHKDHLAMSLTYADRALRDKNREVSRPTQHCLTIYHLQASSRIPDASKLRSLLAWFEEHRLVV